MLHPFFRHQKTERERAVPAVAVILVFSILLQLSPFSFSCDAVTAAMPDRKEISSFKTLQVCDDGTSLTGFMSDHPWIPDGATSFSPSIEEKDVDAGEKPRLTEGFPAALFKPPRASKPGKRPIRMKSEKGIFQKG